MNNRLQLKEQYSEVKKQIKQYFFEFAAAMVLVGLMLLLQGKIINQFPNLENVFGDLLVGFIGSAISLLVVMIFYLLYEICMTKFVVNSILRSCTKNDIDKKIKRMIQATYDVQPHWGRVPNDKHTHPSNIAEGLLAYASAYEVGLISQSDKAFAEIQSLAEKCIEKIIEKDEPSTGFKYTTQALSMQLLAIEKCKSLGIVTLLEEQTHKIEIVVNKLLDNAQMDSRGWGYYAFDNCSASDDSEILMVPTLWALRAINAWGFGSYDRFKIILEKISKESFPIGFKYKSEPRFSATALFCLLVSELNDYGLQMKYRGVWNAVSKSLINGSCPEYEVEISYFNDKDNHLKANYWIHLSRCILIEAAIKNRCHLTIRQALAIKKMIDQSAAQIINFYQVGGLTENEAMIPLYPSFYLISALVKLFSKRNSTKNE